MIVPTMSYQEVEMAFRREVKGAWSQIGNLAKKFGSMALKTRIYPCIRSFTALSKDKTKLTIIFFADKRSCWNHPRICVYTTFYRNDGLYVISTDNPEHGEVRLYTEHFFERYRERLIQDTNMSMMEIIKHYLIINQDLMWHVNTSVFSSAYEKYEHDNVPQMAACVVEGNCFIEQLGEKLTLFKTFLTDNMFGDEQSYAFKKLEMMRQRFAAKNQKK